MRPSLVVLILVGAGLLGVGTALVTVPRIRAQAIREARARSADERLATLGQCLTLSRWWLRPGQDGGVVVHAEVVPGRDGRIALDARATQGADEVLAPELPRAKLLPAVAHAGQTLTLERAMRRVRAGDPDQFSLRLSCRPPGPAGIFGVIEYDTGINREGDDGFGAVVRPLPPQAPRALFRTAASPPGQ